MKFNMVAKMLFPFAFLICISVSFCDIYMHNPRGSNDRLNENSANRKNANRLFDSQNNNRGGYNVGDLTKDPAGGDEDKQYSMRYFQSSGGGGTSHLTVEWTNQHGCGGSEATDPHKQNCQLLLQYMCQPADVTGPERVRDGTSTQTNTYTERTRQEETLAQRNARRANQQENRGVQDPWDHYDECYVRERNKGLFTADQLLQKNKLQYSGATHTRQNPGGDRYGYECPEERDYWPYWHPSPWRDVAVMTDHPERCATLKRESYNVRTRHVCVGSNGKREVAVRWNNEAECLQNSGRWAAVHSYLEKTTDGEQACNSKGYKWAVPWDATDVNQPECLVPLAEPECKQADWSRSNHLGNGRGGQPLNYTWALPHFPSGVHMRCALRIRYNISTDDYDPYNTDSRYNQNLELDVLSPVQNNPVVEVGASTPLRLAINTAQTGRVFQDRSHVFLLSPRPQGLEARDIYNLNVRGKRGNIVQAYPAVEYDFVPADLAVGSSDLVHIQWTGSNTHNNGAPAGDGQQGDDGNGKGGTDRNNMLEVGDRNDNFPLPDHAMSLFREATLHWAASGSTASLTWRDVALQLATSGYYTFEDSVVGTPALNKLLDNAPASYEGVVLSFKRGTYHFMCTRNNDFTNRSQKSSLIVR